MHRSKGKLKLEEMKDIDVTKVDVQDLVDIREVKVNKALSQKNQVIDYVRQIKNPYCYKYGNYVVKISFENTETTLTERLKELILKTVNKQ